MCIEKAREAINAITGLSRPEKRGFAVLLNEIGEIKTDICELKQESAATRNQMTEMMQMIVAVHKKITEDKIDAKAAQMDMINAAANKKYVRWLLVALVGMAMLSGVGVMWFVEHSRQTAEVVQAIK